MHPIVAFCMILYGIAINIVSFILMGRDKRKAEFARWRTPESILFLFAFLGGSVGIYMGMQVFRHKTKHSAFRFGIPILFFYK